jgi:pyrroloquinoline quinone biosynthesis protein D
MTAPSQLLPQSARPQISPRARIQIDKVSGKPVLLFPEGALLLNPTGHAILQLCDGNAAIADIVGALSSRYKMPSAEVSNQVNEFLVRLRQRNLIEITDPSPSA